MNRKPWPCGSTARHSWRESGRTRLRRACRITTRTPWRPRRRCVRYVCGQCHVEYYFKGAEKRLTFPWEGGLTVDDALAYYDKVGHKDWVHKDTGAPALKAQHPEFEMYNQGVHARSGVACADCHMPYKREGGLKISDHHVRSPMLNVNRACQGCHHFPEEEMKDRVADPDVASPMRATSRWTPWSS